MTEPRGPDDHLGEAFRALHDEGEVPEEVRERIWLAVSGALPAEERLEVVESTVLHPAYAHAWRVAHEMWQAAQAAEAATIPVEARPRGPWWTPRWLAAAAAVVLGAGLGVMSLLDRPPAEEYRAPGGYRVESLLPADAALPREAFRLRWVPGPAGSRYTLRVTTEDLEVLAIAANLDTAELTVEPASLANVASGATVLWQVDVSLPTGEQVTSDTFAAAVR